MTWSRFKALLLRFNVGLVAVGWIAFWGYGVAVGDVPPLAATPGLVLLTIPVCLVGSALFFLACHFRLAMKANGRVRIRTATKATFLAWVGSLGLGVLFAFAGQQYDGIAFTLVLIGLIGGIVWTMVALQDAAPHVGRSYFTKSEPR